MKPLSRQKILITGATDGIGKLAALQLAREQAHVLVHGRDQQKLARVVAELKETSANHNIAGLSADFAALDEVRRLAEDVSDKHPQIDVLINNAGVGTADERLSRDGHELRFAVNYLAPFLLTQLLLPTLKRAAPARIVNVASAGQHPIDFDDLMLERHFSGSRAYGQSKLALIMFTFELAQRIEDDGITVNCLHPGTYLDTNMVRRAGITPLGEPGSGADAEVYLAASQDVADTTGKYFDRTTAARADAQAYDQQARKRLWDVSMALTGLKA